MLFCTSVLAVCCQADVLVQPDKPMICGNSVISSLLTLGMIRARAQVQGQEEESKGRRGSVIRRVAMRKPGEDLSAFSYTTPHSLPNLNTASCYLLCVAYHCSFCPWFAPAFAPKPTTVICFDLREFLMAKISMLARRYLYKATALRPLERTLQYLPDARSRTSPTEPYCRA